MYEKVWGEDHGKVRQGAQTVEAKYWMGIPLETPEGLRDPAGDPHEAAKKGEYSVDLNPASGWMFTFRAAGYEFYKRLQSPDGHWSGE